MNAALSFSVSLFLFCSPVLVGQRIYVSPTGDDRNTGRTATSPLRTFQAAADRARNLGAGTVVEFANGEYVFRTTATLDASHSGLRFEAANGSRPVFSSLVRVTGWTRFNGSVMRARLPAGVGRVRYLQDRSENWMPRSATAMFTSPDASPHNNNEPRAYDDGVAQRNKSRATFLTSGNLRLRPVPNWNRASQYDLRVHQTDWSVNIVPIASVSGNAISLRYAATYENLATTDGDTGAQATEMWILNTIEGIDTPGEWAVVDGYVYLYPRSGTDDIYVPRLTELIKVDAGGDGNTWTGTPVRGVVFRGITFTGLDYLVTGPQGTATNPGTITTQHDWGIVDGPASALRFRNAEDCEVNGCTFTKSGSGGVRLDRYAQRILVEENSFSYLGREAVLLGGRGPGYGDVNRNNVIAYNTITTPGREKWDCPAINVDQSSGNHIHHNYIGDVYMSALHLTSSRSVYFGFMAYDNAATYYRGRECHFWEVHPSVVQFIRDNRTRLGFTEAKVESQRFLYNHDNRFEKNVLRDVHNMATLSNGQLYVSGGKRNATNYLTQNYICDSDANTQLLYTDSYLDDLDVRGNMVHNCTNGIIWDYNGWYEDRGNRGGIGRFTANILQASVTETYIGGQPARSNGRDVIVWRDLGNLLFNSRITGPNQSVGSTTGVAAQLADYVDSYLVLASGELPRSASLPGHTAMRNALAGVIRGLNGTVPVANGWADLELGTAGAHGVPNLTGAGALTASQPLILRVRGALENANGLLILGPSRIDARLLGATLVPSPAITLPVRMSARGRLVLNERLPSNVGRSVLYLQVAVFDAAAPQGVAATNGLSVTTR